MRFLSDKIFRSKTFRNIVNNIRIWIFGRQPFCVKRRVRFLCFFFCFILFFRFDIKYDSEIKCFIEYYSDVYVFFVLVYCVARFF